MHLPGSDTIAAISTPIGEGAIAVIRLSGPDAISIADRHFKGKTPLSDVKTHTVHFGLLIDPDGAGIDDVLVTVFRAPNSYTAEDVVEISGHGSVFLANKILSLALRSGARMAEPGEFTKRAFLNGRMDLTQAEAVADLIQSHSAASHNQALSHQRGDLSSNIKAIREEIIDTCSLVELDLDFTEEGLEIASSKKILGRLSGIEDRLTQLIDSFELGKVIREGIRIAIVGEPNVGKSSILNALLRERRAIVTDISGTTRDTIEEDIQIRGLLCTITDTAGIRDTDDPIEIEGINRTREQIENSDLVLAIADSVNLLNSKRVVDFQGFVKSQLDGDRTIVVANKIDQLSGSDRIALAKSLNGYDYCFTSATTGEGIHELEELIHVRTRSSTSLIGEKTVMISRLRHKHKLEESREWIRKTMQGIGEGVSSELWAVDLRTGLTALSEIVGQNISDEVLTHIFSKFCIGK